MINNLISYISKEVGRGIRKDISKDFENLSNSLIDSLKNMVTTTVTIPHNTMIYVEISKYVQKHCEDQLCSKYRFYDNIWKNENIFVKTNVKNGSYFVPYQGTWLFIKFYKVHNDNKRRSSKFIDIICLGKKLSLINNFLYKFVKKIRENVKKETHINLFTHGRWNYFQSIPHRKIESVFIEEEKKNKIFSSINNFINSKKWYEKHGIPYHLGILLHGEPGSGKTSLIKAIAAKYEYSIFYLKTIELPDIEKALVDLPTSKCIIVIEDIDCDISTHKRNKNTNHIYLSDMKNSDLSVILNSLDGIVSSQGYILIGTTNHIDKIDSALLRPGRFDISIKIDYISLETFNQFLTRHFDTTVENIKIKDNISGADLQQMVREKKTCEEIIALVTTQE